MKSCVYAIKVVAELFIYIYLFLGFADVSYGRFIAVLGLICQRVFRTVGDRRGEI